MLKIINRYIFYVFCLCLVFSSAYATTGYTYVTVTNNTNEKLTVQPTLTTTDLEFKQGKYWDGSTLTLAPYETKQLLWFSRYQGVKTKHIYQFDLIATQANYPGENVKATFFEKGHIVYGSEITSQLTIPGQSAQTILTKNELQKFPAKFWNNNYVIYARTWLPLAMLYNNYHIIIDKLENNTFDTTAKQKLSILTYNTQLMPFYAGVEDDLNQPNVRIVEITKRIGQYDVVILEELFDRDMRIKITNALHADYPYHTNVVGRDTAKPWTGGVMIFSKWPILKEDQIVYQASMGIDKLAAKGAVYIAIDKQGKTYHIIGTHAQAGGDKQGIRVRQRQLQEINNFIDRLAIPADQPLLLGGDFNINQFKPDVKDLLDILQVDLLDNQGYLYSADSSINTMLVGTSHARVDYVFYSRLHAKARSAFNKVFIVRALDNEKMWPKFDLSDHFPVASYFDFTQEKI